ncbi:MAG: ABC transporter [Gammaproteobacteria bacterium]|nr:MAG: ABC transporter [Gammaproteobacteria bacterium]
MPQVPVETNDRMSLRIASDEKSLLMRAAALQHTNLTEFVLRNVMLVARKIIDENERLALTERDSLHVLELLDNPPVPNDKLMAAAFAMPKRS